MTTLGSLLTVKDHAPSSSHLGRTVMLMSMVGILAGIAVSAVHAPLHLPGHKALFWLTPIIAARLLNRMRWGASVSTLTCGLTTLALGGNLAGGPVMMPVIACTGIALDFAINLLERANASRLKLFISLSLIGCMINLLCMAMRLLMPGGFQPSTGDSQSMWVFLSSHGLFGAIAGFMGTGISLLCKNDVGA